MKRITFIIFVVVFQIIDSHHTLRREDLDPNGRIVTKDTYQRRWGVTSTEGLMRSLTHVGQPTMKR